MILNARKRTQRGAYFALAALLLVSSVTAGVPFLFSQKAAAMGETTVLSTNLNSWDRSDTRAKGHNEIVPGALHVYTEDNSSLAKAAGYYATPGLTLNEVSSASMETKDASGVLPGLQLGVDRDGNGTWDGYLVYEPGYYGAGNWWTSKTGFGVPEGSGYTSMGTLAQYQTANPNAKVLSVGYSLGSGVKGDVTITKMTFGTRVFTFDLPKLTAPTSVMPLNNTVTSNASFENSWTAVPGAAKYQYEANYSVNGTPQYYTDTTDAGNYASNGNTIVRRNSSAPDATYAWRVRAIDSSGIAGDWSALQNVTVDTTTPLAPAALTPNGWTNGANEFTWSAPADAGSSLSYELEYGRTHPNNVAESGIVKSNTNSVSVVLADGPLFWHVRAVDAAGNYGPWSAIQSATIDSTAPVLTPSLKGGVLKGTQFITLNISEPYLKSSAIRIVKPDYSSVLATPGVSNQAGTGNPLTYAWNTKLVSDGAYKIQYGARDILDHATNEFYDVVVDNTPPVITPSADANKIVSGVRSFTINQTEANPSTLYIEYDEKGSNGNWVKKQGQQFDNTNSATLTVDTKNWNDGQHQIKVTSKDAAGNASGYSFTVNVDNTAPDAPVITTPAFTNNTNVTVSWTDASSDVASYTLESFRDAAYTDLIGSATYPGTQTNVTLENIPEGTYYLRLSAKDGQANRSAYGYAKVTVDKTGPAVSLASPAPGTTFGNGASVTINGTTGDAAMYTLSIKNSSGEVVASEEGQNFSLFAWNTEKLESGMYTVTLTGKDQAGNVNTSSVNLNVDNTGPSTTVNAGIYDVTKPTFSGTVDTDAVAVGIAVTDEDGNIIEAGEAKYAAGSATWTYDVQTALNNGTSYIVVAVAADQYGNTSDVDQAGYAFERIVLPVATQPTTVPTLPVNGAATPPATTSGTTNTDAATPSITNPGFASVLGASTTNGNNTEASDTGVKGTTDDKTASIVNSDANQGRMFGLAWYWWLLIIAAAAAAVWWIIAGARRRNEA